MTKLKYILEKLLEAIFGAIGGFLTGVLAEAVYGLVIFQHLLFQEGWYRQYAHLMFVPLIIIIFNIALLYYVYTVRGFVLSAALMTPSLLIYLCSRLFLPLSTQYGWIEFVFFWILLGQIAATSLAGIWVLGLRSIKEAMGRARN